MYKRQGDTRGGDHGDGSRTERTEYAPERVERAVFEIQPRDERHKDAGRKDGTDGRGDGAGDPSDLDADEGRGIDDDGAGRHLRNGDEISELRHGEPVMLCDDLLTDERHGRVAAAEGKRAEIQCGPEQLPQDFFLAFRAASPYEEYSAFRAVCKMTFCKK